MADRTTTVVTEVKATEQQWAKLTAHNLADMGSDFGSNSRRSTVATGNES